MSDICSDHVRGLIKFVGKDSLDFIVLVSRAATLAMLVVKEVGLVQKSDWWRTVMPPEPVFGSPCSQLNSLAPGLAPFLFLQYYYNNNIINNCIKS